MSKYGRFDDLGEWLEHERAAKEYRSALHNIRARGDELGIDMDTLDLKGGGKRTTDKYSAGELLAMAEDINAEIRSAEREWFYDEVEGVSSPAEVVELMLDLAGNKFNKKALKERLNVDSHDLLKLADELLDLDKADRAYYLNSETRDMVREQRAQERQLLGSAEFMAKVEQDAKGWMQ